MLLFLLLLLQLVSVILPMRPGSLWLCVMVNGKWSKLTRHAVFPLAVKELQ